MAQLAMTIADDNYDFADPESGIGFGYVMNRTGTDLVIDPRARR